MKLFAHRGLWREFGQNSLAAFDAAIQRGFGIETDIRDFAGKLVISHDPSNATSIDLVELLKLPGVTEIPLALNIKADGLASLLRTKLFEFGIHNYFVFDMSIPDMQTYLHLGMNVYTRKSDIETIPIQLEKCQGVWVDTFSESWYTSEGLEMLMQMHSICIVSEELHGRPHYPQWEILKQLRSSEHLAVCTDFPDELSSLLA